MTKARSNASAPAAKGQIVVGTGTDTSGILSVGSANQVLTVDSSTATGLKWAAPASGSTTWTLRNSNGSDSNGISTIAYNGSNLYVAGSLGGHIYTSPDGKTWTSRTSGFGILEINKIIYANNIWVAVGQNGTITTSTDGITWTARTSNMSSNAIRSIHYAAGYFVVVGAGGGATNTGGVAYSTDGITWTRKSMTPTVGTTYWDVTHNGTNWLVVTAQSSGNNAIYASDPSATWTVISMSPGNSAFWCAYDGTRTLMADASGSYYYSTSTTFGTWTVYSGVAAGSSGAPSLGRYTYYYNNRIYVTNGLYLQDFSTAQTNAIPNSISQVTLSPSTYINSSAGLDSTMASIWAGAAGQMTGESWQIIRTSF